MYTLVYRALISVAIGLIGSSTAHVSAQKGKTPGAATPKFILESQFQDYVPVSPLDYDEEVEIWDKTSLSFKKVRIKQLAADKEAITQFLSNEAVYTSLRQNDVDGSLKFGPATFTGDIGSYEVVYDYCKFATLRVTKPDGSCPGFVKVGVGVRIRANIQTFEAGVDVSSLLGLAIQANAKRLSGQFSVDVIGMESRTITDLLTLPTDISQASVQASLQSLAAIKSKIYEADTRLYPQIVSIKKTSGCSVFDLLDQAKLASSYQSEELKMKQQQQQQQQQK